MASNNETVAKIVREMRVYAKNSKVNGGEVDVWNWLADYADRIEAAHKRMADCIHLAMVIIAGIEMENSDDPPRLWTALEDAYDALSYAMGTDGETTADVEEAKTSGRYFVVKSFCNAANMRYSEELRECLKEAISASRIDCGICNRDCKMKMSFADRTIHNCERIIQWRKALEGVKDEGK